MKDEYISSVMAYFKVMEFCFQNLKSQLTEKVEMTKDESKLRFYHKKIQGVDCALEELKYFIEQELSK